MKGLRPRSLAGQLALLVGLALFLAQAINFALLLGERRERRINQVVVPAVVRIVNAAERIQRGGGRPRARPARPRRVEVSGTSAVAGTMVRQPVIEERARAALTEAGWPPMNVYAAETSRAESGMVLRPRATMRRASGRVMILSVQLRPTTWLTTRTPIRSGDAALVWRLLGQTAILYVVLLAGVLWIGRRAARPLRELADAAEAFGRSGAPEPIAERGPADIRALTAAFNAMRERLAATLAEKDRMLGAIGHDLRTPLASLRLRAENVEDDAERARMVDTIAEMSGTLDDILALAQAGRSREPVAPFDLSALVDAIVEDLRDLGADVTFEPSTRIALDLRPVLTRRAIRNVVENAIKYGTRATVRVRREGTDALVEVEDEGPGLSENVREHVFESFTRLETSRNRQTGGAGLGLALARAIVRDQGGEIRLENRSSGGLRATITLPAPRAGGGS